MRPEPADSARTGEKSRVLGADTVLGKVIQVLHAFRVDDHGVSFTDLQRRTGLPKATLHRTLADLTAARLLDRGEEGYHLGRHLFELGMLASVERGLIEVATPFLEDLYERTHETVHLGLRERHEVVYVAKMGGHRQVRSPSRLGGRMPVHATAIGKALLAHAPAQVQEDVLAAPLARLAPRTITTATRLRKQLDDVVEHGIAYEFEESAVGLLCIAAPVLDRSESAVAAVSVTGPVNRFRPQLHVASVRAAASGIAATLARREELRSRE
jgi:DNA-binding IclR family transcriptional regulator